MKASHAFMAIVTWIRILADLFETCEGASALISKSLYKVGDEIVFNCSVAKFTAPASLGSKNYILTLQKKKDTAALPQMLTKFESAGQIRVNVPDHWTSVSDHELVIKRDREIVYKVPSADCDDQGIYECVFKFDSDVKEKKKQAVLTLTADTEPTCDVEMDGKPVGGPDPSIDVREGQTVRLACKKQLGDSPLAWEWLKGCQNKWIDWPPANRRQSSTTSTSDLCSMSIWTTSSDITVTKDLDGCTIQMLLVSTVRRADLAMRTVKVKVLPGGPKPTTTASGTTPPMSAAASTPGTETPTSEPEESSGEEEEKDNCKHYVKILALSVGLSLLICSLCGIFVHAFYLRVSHLIHKAQNLRPRAAESPRESPSLETTVDSDDTDMTFRTPPSLGDEEEEESDKKDQAQGKKGSDAPSEDVDSSSSSSSSSSSGSEDDEDSSSDSSGGGGWV
ncbi:uncharacterized protein LOC101857688, partial [Aplysia californica]|uniref:Uncharacterized protein LOC101857688 n=1 Tax=Aplysia californica TaxID=6500 RepID=A0ABM1VQD9_APLCA